MTHEEVAVPLPNAGHRQILQRLRTDVWRSFAKLNIPASDGLLERLANNGWIERRRMSSELELKLTAAGLDALRAKIPVR